MLVVYQETSLRDCCCQQIQDDDDVELLQTSYVMLRTADGGVASDVVY